MKHIAFLLVVLAAGCSSPTAPTPPVSTPPVSVTPPVVTPPVAPADDGLTRDPRFSLNFYRVFALGGGARPLSRMSQAPAIYLYTVDDTGRPVDTRNLDAAASAMIAVAGDWSGGRFGLEGIERGPGPAPFRLNRISVTWSPDTTVGCGAEMDRTITLYYRASACQCNGVIRSRTVKHELGHAMGFSHTFDTQDLMSGLSDSRCDQAPSDRERFHSLVAYSRPIGSLDP